MTTCPHGMPSPGSCLDCMDEGNLPPAPKPEQPVPGEFWFAAKFAGTCRGCGLAFPEGQPIRRLSDHSGYVHDGCTP